MKILLTTHQFFPQFVAGTEVLTYSVARELIKRGHTVCVLTGYPGSSTLQDSERFDEYDFEGIHVYRFHHAYTPMGGQVSMIEVGYDNRLSAYYFDQVINQFRPDITHIFHLNRLGSGIIERAVEAGIPCFMTPTDFWAICPTAQLSLADGSLCEGPSIYSGNCLKHLAQSTQKGLITKVATFLPTNWADQLVRLSRNGVMPEYLKQEEISALANRLPVNVSRLNKLQRIVVANKFMSDLLVRYGVRDDLITVVAYGIAVTIPDELSKQRSEYRGPLRVAFIGTLAPHKGCHILIEAFKKLPAECATLKIYGKLNEFQDYVTHLEKSASGYNAMIEFLGTFPNSQIMQIFTDIDVLVVPSIWYENTPLVVYSAQAAGCPVVVSNLPGLAEIIQDEENGLLFEPNNSIDLARKLLLLVNDNDLLQRLSAHAIPPKSSEIYVDELLNLWQSGVIRQK